MATYTVKNSAGEWLFYDYDLRSWGWTSLKEARHTWDYKPDAERESRINDGKVYCLRRTSAKRERKMVARFLRFQSYNCNDWISGPKLRSIADAVERGEHMRKTKVPR